MPTTQSWTYTSTGSEGLPSNVITAPLGSFTGNFTLHIHASTPSTSIVNWHVSFYDTVGALLCWDNPSSMSPGDSDYNTARTVGDVPSNWHGTSWNQIQLNLPTASNRPGAGITWTLSVTADFVPTVLCAYGTQSRDPSKVAVEVGFGLLDNLGITRIGWWAVPIILAELGTPILIDHLCATLPPPDPTILAADWTTASSAGHSSFAVDKVLNKFEAEAWNFF